MPSPKETPLPPPLPGVFSLVIPAHNEALNIGGIIAKASYVLPTIAERFEIIVVDDGSTDDTGDVAIRHLSKDAKGTILIIRHAEKKGYGVTVGDGLRAATGEYIGFMDGDGQFNVADFTKLAEHLPNADMVTGRRATREDNWKRKVTSEVFNTLVKILYRIPYDDVDCALKVMHRSFLDDAMPIVARSALLNTELYFKARIGHKRIIQVTIPHYPRLAGIHSGGRLIPIVRAVRELILLRFKLRSVHIG